MSHREEAASSHEGVEEAASSRRTISVEAFMWHPHSIKYSVAESKYTYNDQMLANMDDIQGGGPAAADSSSSLCIELPPRLVVPGKHSYDLQHVAEQWAMRRGYHVVAFGHVVACTSSRKLLFVDFVLERKLPRRAATKQREYALACVYYSQCRGGRDLQVARDYMSKVQSICNRQMQFFPKMVALCAYDGSQASAFFGCTDRQRKMMLGRFDIRHSATRRLARGPRVYATDVTQ